MLAISGQRMAALEGGSNAILRHRAAQFVAISMIILHLYGELTGDDPELYILNLGLKIPVTVDNTSSTGRYLVKPIEHGADIGLDVMEQQYRYSDCDGGKFSWNNGRFSIFTNPSSDYHGLIYWDTSGYVQRFEQAENALELAKWLESRDDIL
ncbi:hypothetical protein RhiirC2_851068 [Rhizophagus irregularis]|uniref:Uncharacterized protein n=1 Tax=Rhizophagus irregularis TaxID=588596 RepID=A0A2N1N4Y1_9GLOM|nr:hypothetical protein RhiirC2_851068 [Rhizophagus irregularis]